MTKLRQNFELWAGEDKLVQFTITASDGSGQDMTGNTASWVLTDEFNTGSLVKLDGVISASLVNVTIEGSSHTSTLAGNYYHQLASTASGSAVMLAVGMCQIYRNNV